MILSKTCEYAMRAALCLAAQQTKEFIPIREMAEKLDISFHFLTKILQILTQKKILKSFKGPNGGVALARPACTIKLSEIIMAVDGDRLFCKCLINEQECDDENPCPLHYQWVKIRAQLHSFFASVSLAEAAKNEQKELNMLKW